MIISGLLRFLSQSSQYQTLLERVTSGHSLGALDVIRAARPFVLASLARDWPGTVIYVTARVDRAHNVSEQLPVWLGDPYIVDRFAEPAAFFYERSAWGEGSIRNRLETLSALALPIKRPKVVVTSARAIMQRTLPPQLFRERAIELKVGQRHRIEKLLEQWLHLGYEPASIVTQHGGFSRRGGILDIYPLASPWPVRIEFFDDEIDSLRFFDPSLQRSTERIDSLLIPPAREALPEFGPQVAERLGSWFEGLETSVQDPANPREDASPLAAGTAFQQFEFYIPYLYEQTSSLLDYASDDALFVVEDIGELQASVEDIARRAHESQQEKADAHLLPPDYPQPYLGWDELEAALKQRTLVDFGLHHDTGANEQTLSFRGVFAPERRFGGQLKTFISELRALRDSSSRSIAVTVQAPRLLELWRETDPASAQLETTIEEVPPERSITLVEGSLNEGWQLRIGDNAVHLFTDAEIFGWARPEPRRRQAPRRTRTPELLYSDLREGDFVVHIDYGVGRFVGMRRRTLEDIEREYLLVEYGGTDALYVPIHQTDRLTRYVGPDDKPPVISKLGQADWSRIRTKAQKAVEEEAQELLALYAARASAPGHAFHGDTPWQHELEASFPFVETEDQLKAVRSVKMDMEKPHPMDRLICGDVGYGKTEVALRAAFKAVMDGKQVALLVPTTILAQQHYETFSRRMSAFPVVLEALSRFRTRSEQNAIIAKLAEGEVDVIIGTHRLLQSDVRFKELGLIIIDEEQRFGVKHKEHLKALRTQVDVLTLTATPIPRTLYMGLTGVRDISMIQTPPEERLPVITVVGTFDERLVRQAVLREMERGGQVFFVHNRVQSIDLIAEKLARIVPEARIIVGHGQMDERSLEHVMEAFGNGEYDILLSTSIIESGLDIPNANTLIVDRADWFGMSQLYQLRGRVGRSAQQAYAYFFHPPESRLTEEARARLETLSEYVELGSGFQIAMRDLELRGAGDILSTRQTGHVAAIGLHLYTQMLAQAVSRLKGSDGNERAHTLSDSAIVIDLPMPAYLPTDYIEELELRLQLYRRIGGLTAAHEVKAMREELKDRFGDPPPAVEGLLYQIEVKLLAEETNATAIVRRGDHIEVRLPYLVEVNRDLLGLRLGRDLRVTRTAVEIPFDKERWQSRLTAALQKLRESRRIGTGA